MKEEALILKSDDSPANGQNMAKVLGFFGVSWRALTVKEFLSEITKAGERRPKTKLFCSSRTLLELLTNLAGRNDGIRLWREQVHSAFVHAESNPNPLLRLTNLLTGESAATTKEMSRCAGDFIISGKSDDVCGVLRGLRIAPSKGITKDGFLLASYGEKPLKLISTEDGAVFLKLNYHGVPVFLSTCSRVADPDAALPTGIFDVRDHVPSAVPVVLYVKWAFGKTCWNGTETNACLIIDDPLLKPDYGFVNFRELLSLMKRHRFSTNIAFIPWNWKRSSPEIVRLFKENPDHFSLSVHGCDHIRGEFGSHDQEHLYWKAGQGIERMAWHKLRTGINHDPVMVFPQGVFSSAAMGALKHAGLIAAVNNDTISVDANPRTIRVLDVWDIAMMGYSSFPLFTRRYPWEGVENFAFDMLLGKPCLVIIHHDFCHDGYLRLAKFIDSVNALKCPPSWCSLGQVIRRSCRQREISPGTLELEMYGTELAIKNDFAQTKRFLISRRETGPSSIKKVSVGLRSIEWEFSDDRIHFEIELEPRQEQTISMAFHDLGTNVRKDDNLPYKARTMLRRYLSEVRDNYVTRIQTLVSGKN
jgi:hypothetical protein